MENNNQKLPEFLNAREVSQLLNINEKKVYTLAREGRIPATKVTGKWLFPRLELVEMLRRDARAAWKKFTAEEELGRRVILIAGSDDPALPIVHGLFHLLYPDFALFTSSVGSSEGLRFLHRGLCHIALSHLYSESADDYTFPFVDSFFPGTKELLVVINLFFRRIGFLSIAEEITSFKDIAKKSLRFINRQKGSGIRARVDELIVQDGLKPQEIEGFDQEVCTHLEVAAKIASGASDAGMAVESAAKLSNLRFYPLFEERFDMIVFKETFFEESIQAFVEFVRSDVFKQCISEMKGYDTRMTGKVLYPKGESI